MSATVSVPASQDWLAGLCSGWPHQTVGTGNTTYLQRWFLWPRNRWLNCCLHHCVPRWHSAARYVSGQPLFRTALQRTIGLEPRQRDSIVIVMREELSPWNRLRKSEESRSE